MRHGSRLIHQRIICTFVAMIVALTAHQPICAQFVRTNAFVNLLDGPHPSEAYGQSATASSQAHFSNQDGNASASSFAVPQALSSAATSHNVGGAFPASGDAGFREDFRLPETSQTITLDVRLGVSLQCITTPGDLASVASVTVLYDFFSSAGRARGSGQIGCQAGVPVIVNFVGGFENGDLTTSVISEATLTPTINFAGVIEKLTSDDLEFLGLLDLDLTVPLDQLTIKVSIQAGLVAEALNLLGLSRLGIPSGLELEVGFAVDYSVQGGVSVSLPVSPNGILRGFVNAIASGSFAEGSSSISGTLQSATVDESIPNPELLELEVEFDSGRRLKVYQASRLVLIDSFETGDISAWTSSSES